MVVKLCLLVCLCIASTCAADMSDELKEILRLVTPNFEENLKRAFINEGIRNQHKYGDKAYPLDNVFVTIESSVVELRNLKLTRTPDFRVNTFDVDLGMLTINLGLNLGQLKIEGEYEVTNKALQKYLPISHIGKILIILDNVSCDGKVGIYMKEDSFVVENYDLRYRPSEETIRVSYYKEDGVEVDNEVVETSVDRTLVRTFWIELNEVITGVLHRQLGSVIVEFSVSELLIDEPEELRELSRQHALRANRLLDALLCAAKTYLVEQDTRILMTPPLSVAFNSRPPGTQQGSFDTDPGEIQDLSTLTRTTQMSLFEDKDVLFVYGQINLRDFKYNHEQYRGEYAGSVSQGSVRTTIYRNRVFVKISVRKESGQATAHLDAVQVRTVSDIDMDVSGLGSLSWLRDRLRSWIVGNLRNEALSILEGKIADALNHAISITDCSAVLSN